MKHKIQWCNEVWNPVWGCKGSCNWCYARIIAKRFGQKIGKHNNFSNGQIKKLKNFEPTMLPSNWTKNFPEKPIRIFVNSMSDFAFWKQSWQKKILELIKGIHKHHTFIILTKFPEKLKHIRFPINVWLGISAENQKNFDTRIRKLIHIIAGKHIVSLEPLQENIKIDNYYFVKADGTYPFKISEKFRTRYTDIIDWVIVGGQTGAKAAYLNPDYVRNIQKDCQKYDVPFFFKSWGSYLPLDYNGTSYIRKSKNDISNILDNKQYLEFPEKY